MGNKLTARLIDIGARKVKNIPEPVHAYIVATWDDGRSHGQPLASVVPARANSARKWLAIALIGVFTLGTAALAFFLVNQRPVGKASSAPGAAAALPPLPPPATSSTPTPAIRRTNSGVNEADATKRSLQACKDLALQRGWTGATLHDRYGQSVFIEKRMQGSRN